jgi:hypothetical protein
LLITIAIASLSLTGCFHIRYIDAATTPADSNPSSTHNNYIIGLAEGDHVDVGQACPHGYAVVDSEVGFIDWLIQGVTLQLWDPKSITISCATSPAPTSAPASSPPPLSAPPAAAPGS